jgi:ZIP family zinc transporter
MTGEHDETGEHTPATEEHDPTADGGVAVEESTTAFGLPRWLAAIIPVVLLIGLLGVLAFTSPFAGLQSGEPLPDVTVTHHTLPDDETIVLHVTNNGPESVTISQVLVDDAYWEFEVAGAGGDRTLSPRESARVEIPYHWNPGWDLEAAMLLSNGATIHHEIIAPQESPGFTFDILWTLALVGLFVGVIPVALGMLWFPFIQGMSDRALHAILLFAAGVLGFLAFDAGFEALELAERVPGVYEGQLLVVVSVVSALLLVQSISSWRKGRVAADGGTRSGLWVGYLVALSIGLHNLAEGLAIGSSFALGRVALGTFLIVGFMLHNVTEGPAIVAPVARGERPDWWHFVGLGLLAGAPVILGGWIGGFVYSPTLGAIFLALGVGAILQVNWEIAGMVRDQGGRLASALNLLAFLVGFAVMYVTDVFVAL